MIEAHREAFRLLFKQIAPQYLRRWMALLEGTPAHWGKIMVCNIWPGDVYDSIPDRMDWSRMVDTAIERAQAHRISHALVLTCRSTPGIEAVALPRLRQHLCQPRLDEGFVSLVPGTLALATNHEGGCWLIDTTKREKP